MFLLKLLPDSDSPTGPKEPTESRKATRKKVRSNPCSA
jgi:hypothetical protein